MVTSPLLSSDASLGAAITSSRTEFFSGRINVPGDKSISHRALMLAASAVGDTLISGLLEGEDVLATAQALRLLGARIENISDGAWRVTGRGVGGLREPSQVLDLGNAGTGVRLHGACCVSSVQQLAGMPLCPLVHNAMVPLPHGVIYSPSMVAAMTVHGSTCSCHLRNPVMASAQVKSAILLPAEYAGKTTVIEPAPAATENMLAHLVRK